MRKSEQRRMEYETIRKLKMAGIESRFVHRFDPNVKKIYKDVWTFLRSEDCERVKVVGILTGCEIAVLEWKETEEK